MKQIFKTNFITGGWVILILSVLISFVLINPAADLAITEYELHSFFVDSDIDFVIPEPGKEQVSVLENDESIGIQKISPYYSIGSMRVSGREVLIANGYLFSSDEDLMNSPYSLSRIVEGNSTIGEREAIIDKRFSKKYHCDIGDEISIVVGSEEFSFTVVAISHNNMLFDKGTVAMVTDEAIEKVISDNKIGYGSAFVFAKNLSACQQYLDEEYKGLGDLKDRSLFSSDELYDKYLEHFNSADWSLLITDFSKSYAAESAKYYDANHRATVSFAVAGLLVSLVMFGFAISVASGKKNKDIVLSLLRKRQAIGSLKKIYCSANIVRFLLFVLVTVFLTPIKDIIDCRLWAYGIVILIPALFTVVQIICNLKTLDRLKANIKYTNAD